MSTVTLSKPHCATISAEKPDGIASHALTTALPDFQISLTLFATLLSFSVAFYPALFRPDVIASGAKQSRISPG
jgi:hypothetical protein